ncbi:lysostaphin resistance A-like protein [Singulisphaera rosea]
MPLSTLSILSITVTTCIAFIFMGMLWAWIRTVDGYRRGETLLPTSTPRKDVPWKEGSVTLAALGVFFVPVLVVQVYFALFGPPISFEEQLRRLRAESALRFSLQLIPSIEGVQSLPSSGKNLVIVAKSDKAIYLRIFDEAGKQVQDTNETKLNSEAKAFKDLKTQLTELWPPHELSKSETRGVLNNVMSLLDYPRFQLLSPADLMLISSIANTLLLIGIPLLLQATSRANLADFGLTRTAFAAQARFGVWAFLLFSPVVYSINGLMVVLSKALGYEPIKHPLEEMVRKEFSGWTALLAVISGVVLAPLAEELFFRGVFQSWLSKAIRRGRKRNVPDLEADAGSVLAGLPSESGTHGNSPVPDLVYDDVGLKPLKFWPILLTSAFFALVHAEQWPAPVPLFVLSLGLGLVYKVSGSLVSSIVMHALFNSLSTLFLFYMLLNPPAAELKKTVSETQKLSRPSNAIERSAQVVGLRSIGL